jgi:aspartate dehydrogenase
VKPGHVAIIGFGAIAQDLIGILKEADVGPPERITVLVHSGREAGTKARLSDASISVSSDLEELLDEAPDVVVECAGHGAVAAFGALVLDHGTDLIIASAGALSDPDLKAKLISSANRTGAQCVVPAGAIGGIDALGAARISGLKSVIYIGRKPPSAWLGTPAEQAVDLGKLTRPTAFFEGTAREAAREYPKNANVAATLALAGLGMDDTKVRLIADPTIQENVHEFSVVSNASDFSIRLVCKTSPLNPKTSRSTVYSIARAVLNRHAAIAI